MPTAKTRGDREEPFARGAAVVAGGSGGLGRAVCEAFARQGSAVALLYRSNAAAADDIVAGLQAQGVAAQAWQVDLRDAGAVHRVIAQVAEHFGALHSGVYAAGPAITIDYLSRLSPEQFSDALQGDVLACFNFIQAMLPPLRKGGGALIGITTEQLERVELRGALSSVPKAAVDKLFEVVAKEEARNGIRACCVRAGWVETGLGADALANKLGPQIHQAMLASIPLRRFGAPHEIADVVTFLASARASYVTGVSIPVNGGRHL